MGKGIEKYNYGISAVGYSGSHIEKAEVREINDGTIGPPKRWTVDEIMDVMNTGKYFVSLFNKNGEWETGRRVGKVRFQTFIRSYPTPRRKPKKDDLEDLPRIPSPRRREVSLSRG